MTEGAHHRFEKGKPRLSLSVEEGYQMLRSSFRHSQGDPLLQSNIFEWFHVSNPTLRIDDDLKMKIFKRAISPVIKVTSNPALHAGGESSIDGNLVTESNEMQRVFGIRYFLTGKRRIVKDITEKLIMRDYKYSSGRPHKKGADVDATSPQSDQYLSYFCYYGLEGHVTELPELDSMYKEVTKCLENGFSPRHTIKVVLNSVGLVAVNANDALGEVIRTYYEKHPDTPMPEKAKVILEKIQTHLR